MLDPLKTADGIHSDYARYLTTTFALRNPELRSQFEAAIRDFELTKGPYLEVSPPYLPGRSVRQLMADGVLNRGLDRLAKGFPLDRALYLHQDRAITKAAARRNVVIATGTGSGKTECFLLPILDHLVREAAAGTLATPGVRALLLYPMNALANDQVKRLRRLLEEMPEITFGRYVGETRRRAGEAEEDFRVRYPNEPRLENELISRDAIQARPPHILLTNFAMLEYLLLRPADSPLFDGAFSDRWRFFVSDEAHVYDGAKGTEIAMLLRRVKDRVVQSAPGRVQCIATSATLGRGEKDYPEIAAFASRLFAEAFEWTLDGERQDVIGPERAQVRLSGPQIDLGTETHSAIAKALDGGASLEELHRTVRSIAPEAPQPAQSASHDSYLAALISRDASLLRVWDALKGGPRALRAIASQVFPGPRADEHLVRFVALGARARWTPEDAPVLPARYHLFARALEGVFVCLHPDHSSEEPRLLLSRHEECPTCRPKRSAAMFELGACRKCGAEYICGELRADDRLQQPSATAPVAFFLVKASAGPPANDEDDAVLEGGDLQDVLTLCVGCRSLGAEGGICECGAPKVPVLRLRPAKGADLVRVCAACGGRTGGEVISRFRTGTDAPVAVLATTLYQALPPSTDPRAANLIGEGRKLLCFSDSRQDAAFFAPYLERTYGRAIQRRLILEAIRSCEDDAPRLNDLVLPVSSTAESCRVIDPNDGIVTNRNLIKSWLMREVLAFDRRQSLEGTGLVDVRIAWPRETPPPQILAALGFAPDEAKTLVTMLLDSLRGGGAVTVPPGVDIRSETFAPRNREISVRGMQSEPGVLSWLPGGPTNRRLDLATKVLMAKKVDVDGREVLQRLWDELVNPAGAWSQILVSQPGGATGPVWRLAFDRIEFAVAGPAAARLVCDTCRQVAWRSVAGVCPSLRCEGQLVRPTDLHPLPAEHYRDLYTGLRPIGLLAHEHTAQWTAAEASRIQDEFMAGRVNVLSCSTTFELGVDVGDVEAVLLRNVPPSPANYIQRAGRAGRRTSASALAVTYAQRRNHDTFYYAEPERMISGTVSPPRIYLENASIVRRHVHSVAFALFERLHAPHGTVASFFATGTTPEPCDAFLAWLQSHPQPLKEALGRIIPPGLAEPIGVPSWQWVEALVEESDEHPTWGWLRRAKAEVAQEITQLEAAIQAASAARRHGLAGALEAQLKTLAGRKLLPFLSSRNVIPKYGFPVDVVPLTFGHTGDIEAAKLELERDLAIAITEFAPGSQIVAAKCLWDCVGLGTRPDRGWPRLHWSVCPQCGAFRRALGGTPAACGTCGSVAPAADQGQFVIPVFGFVGKRSDASPGEARPPRLAFSQTFFSEYQGASPGDPEAVENLPLVARRFSRQGRISILNQGPKKRGYRLCTRCGHGEAAPARPANAGPHRSARRPDQQCTGTFSWAQLGHEFLTDVVELRLNVPGMTDEATRRSAMYALLRGVAALDIRDGEMDGTFYHYAAGSAPAVVLFDTVPGGAGHAQRVAASIAAVVREASRIIERCECGLDTSCYGCLRNYRNQLWHDELQRDRALVVLNALDAARGSRY